MALAQGVEHAGRDPVVVAGLVATKIMLAVALSILFFRTPVNALDAPPVPDDKIIVDDISDPAAIQDLDAACAVIANNPGQPVPWEVCVLLWGAPLENAWQQWKQEFCQAYDPHRACYEENLGAYDETDYDALVEELRAKVEDLASRNAIICVKCDEIEEVLQQWRNDAAAAATQVEMIKNDIEAKEQQIEECEDQYAALQEALEAAQEEREELVTDRAIEIAAASIQMFICVALAAASGPIVGPIAILACLATWAIAVGLINDRYDELLDDNADLISDLEAQIQEKLADILQAEQDLLELEQALSDATQHLEDVLGDEEPCDKVAELDACIAEEQALAEPILQCIVNLAEDVKVKRQQLKDQLIVLRDERACLEEIQDNTLGQPVIGTLIQKRCDHWTECLDQPEGCPDTFGEPALWKGINGDYTNFMNSKVPSIVPGNPDVPVEASQSHEIKECDHEDCEDVRQELIDQYGDLC